MSVRFKPSRKAARDLLKSPEVQAMLAREAAQIAARAGAGFTSGVRVGRDRARSYVLPETYAARKRQMRNHVLERAVGGGHA